MLSKDVGYGALVQEGLSRRQQGRLAVILPPTEHMSVGRGLIDHCRANARPTVQVRLWVSVCAQGRRGRGARAGRGGEERGTEASYL